jgi:arylformamidase
MPVEESQEARDRAAIDAAYDPERRAGPRGPHIERYVARSAETREALDCVLDVPYGAAPRETLDIFPSRRAGSPVLLFIHGGYWRALSSKEFSFVAAGLVPHDLTVAVMSYTLCPEATIAEITRQSRAAVAFLAREAQRFAGDPERIVAAGHSAGGQQVGMLLSHNAAASSIGSGARAAVKGGVTISGLFDLRPLQHSWLQPTLQLTPESAADQSPLLCIPSRSVPLLVTVGSEESPAFIDQSLSYHAAWTQRGLASEYFPLEGLNHYQAVDPLADAASPLTSRVVGLIRRCC